METKSKTTLLITDRKGGTVKRSVIRKAVAEAYAERGLAPIWKGKVSKKIIKIR